MNCRKCDCLISDYDEYCPMCNAKQRRQSGVNGHNHGLDGRVIAVIGVILVTLILGVIITNVDFANIFGGNEARRAEFAGVEDDPLVGNHELVGEWLWGSANTPWYRFYEDGSAVNLNDGESFTWYEDGSLNAIIYASWSINNGVLTITWNNGTTFDYSRGD